VIVKLAKLYKKTSTGKIQEWRIEVQKNKYITVSGQVDGKKIISEPTYCTPKNVGRANATTAELKQRQLQDGKNNRKKAMSNP
jgi:hypothetical protein